MVRRASTLLVLALGLLVAGCAPPCQADADCPSDQRCLPESAHPVNICCPSSLVCGAACCVPEVTTTGGDSDPGDDSDPGGGSDPGDIFDPNCIINGDCPACGTACDNSAGADDDDDPSTASTTGGTGDFGDDTASTGDSGGDDTTSTGGFGDDGTSGTTA